MTRFWDNAEESGEKLTLFIQCFLEHYLKHWPFQSKRSATTVLSVKNWTGNRHSDSHCWRCPKPVQTGLTGKTVYFYSFFIVACSYSGADSPKNISINTSFSWAFKRCMPCVERRLEPEKCPLSDQSPEPNPDPSRHRARPRSKPTHRPKTKPTSSYRFWVLV